MSKYCFVAILSLLSCSELCGQVYSLEGQKYYRLGPQSYRLGTNDMLTDEQATDIMRIVEHVYKTGDYRGRGGDMLDELWDSFNVVYKGSLYDDIMLLIFRTQLNFVFERLVEGYKTTSERIIPVDTDWRPLIYYEFHAGPSPSRDYYESISWLRFWPLKLFSVSIESQEVRRSDPQRFRFSREEKASHISRGDLVRMQDPCLRGLENFLYNLLDDLYVSVSPRYSIRRDFRIDGLFNEIVEKSHSTFGTRVAAAFANALVNFYNSETAKNNMIEYCKTSGIPIPEPRRPNRVF